MQAQQSQFNIIDQVIAAQTISALQSTFSSKDGLSFVNMFNLLFIIFMDSIKKLVIKMVEQFVHRIDTNKIDIFKTLLGYFNVMSYFNKNSGRKRSQRKTCKDESNALVFDKIHTKAFASFQATSNFWNALYEKYKLNDESIQLTIMPKFTMKQVNNTTFSQTEIWENIIINSNRFQAVFPQQFKVTFSIENDVKAITSVKVSEVQSRLFDDNHLESFIDLIPFAGFRVAFKTEFEKFYNRLPKPVSELYSPKTMKPFPDITDEDYDYFIFGKIIIALQCFGCIKTDAAFFRLLHELHWLTSVACRFKASNGTEKLLIEAWNKSKTHTFLGISIPHGKCEDDDGEWTPFEIVSKMPELNLVIDWLLSQLIPDEFPYDSEGIKVSLLSESLSISDMQSSWMTYVKSIQQSAALTSRSNKSKFHIFMLKVEETEVTHYEDNPEHKSWEARRQEIKDMMIKVKDNKDMCAELAKNLAEIDRNPQPKQFSHKKIERTVVKEHINDVKKEFSTLYLRKEEKTVLENCMFQFKEKKELLQSLGIPNKLGIMLYGIPGTGKTSSINAIATYLQKNLYYISMNCVKTNNDLKMLFDYINKNCIDGGIAIFEDIDAMTNVVHRRVSNERVLTSAEVLETKDAPLTLEYFLNILQGSLTVDGSIFICTTNHIEKLDPAFYRDGRFDVKIEMKPSDHYQVQEMYMKYFNTRIPDDIIERFPEYTYTPATILARLNRYVLNNAPVEEVLSPFLKA